MTGWHCRCDDEDCLRRCRRPACLRPAEHLLVDVRRVDKVYRAFHSYACHLPLPDVSVGGAARQAIEQLNPNMGPSEVAVARRVIGKMLDRLEQLEHTAFTVIPSAPLLLTAAKEHKRPHVVAAPRELTRAQAQHLQWLAERKERTA